MVTNAAKKNSIKGILSRKISISISLYQIFLLLLLCLICRSILSSSSTSVMNDVVHRGKVEAVTSTEANEYTKCLENRYKIDSNNEGTAINRHPTCRGLKTLSEIMNTMELPCNYVHDGFYLKDSNVVLNEIYLTLVDMFDKKNSTQADKLIPLVVEVGGHDGITKSISLKASQCLKANTLLVEASPLNYNILKKSRAYDSTVNAALCEDDYANLVDNPMNSGETKTFDKTHQQKQQTTRVPCTTLDDEIDHMKISLPLEYEIVLIFLVLDIEGNEPTAIKGMNKYIPKKAMIETKHAGEGPNPVEEWAKKYNLIGKDCGSDECFNFTPGSFSSDEDYWHPRVFYGARKSIPTNTYKTSEQSKSYMHYGK